MSGLCAPLNLFGVDKVCLSQYLDSLFAYFLLGRSEMLVSGHSIFQYSSRGQLTLCVDAAIDWLVIYFIHFNCHREAGF